MSVIRGLVELSTGIKNEILNEECVSRFQAAGNLKDKVIEVLKTFDKVMRKMVVYYPKTMLISFIANVIFNIVFACIANYIGLAINCYLLYRHRNYMFSAIKIYNDKNVSELFSSYAEKQRYEVQIYTLAFAYDLVESVKIFFRRILS